MLHFTVLKIFLLKSINESIPMWHFMTKLFFNNGNFIDKDKFKTKLYLKKYTCAFIH